MATADIEYIVSCQSSEISTCDHSACDMTDSDTKYSTFSKLAKNIVILSNSYPLY